MVSGSLRATDTIYSTTNQFQILRIPTSSNGTTYGPGTNGQVLKSNGTSVYWASDNNSDTNVTQAAAITTAGAYPLILANSTATTAVTGTVNKTSTLTYNPNTKSLVTGGTVNGYTLAAACAKGVTDNSSNADVANNDTNLITGRTLYYQLAKKGYTTNTGTVTSVQVQATSPVTSSTSTAQTGSLNTTIALADAYGDTKNPYGSKTKNYVLAAGATANSVPSFRALVAADIPSLSASKITSDTFDAARIPTLSITDKTSGTLTVARGGTGQTSIANIQAGKDGDGNTISSTYLKLSGGTLTGNINVIKAGDTYVRVQNSETGIYCYLDSDSKSSGGNHGIYSAGYWDGSSYVANGKWLIYRRQGGDVIVNGNCTNVTGTVAIAHGGTGATTAADARTNLGITPANIGAPSASGSGASGTWGINVTGSAGSVAWENISEKPIEFIVNTSGLNSNGWKTLGGKSSGAKIAISYCSNNPASWNSGAYSASLVFGCNDTKGLLDCHYMTPIVTFGGGDVTHSTDNDPKWYFKISGTSGKTYTFPTDSKTLVATDGTGASGTWGINISGNAATATKATKDANGNTISSTYLKLSGGTLDGNITIYTTDEEAYVRLINTEPSVICFLRIDPTTGDHGIYSPGFWNGSSHVSDSKWLIRREQEGNVIVDGDCTGSAANVTGTVAIAHGGTGATTSLGAVQNLFDTSNSVISQYPNKPGIYRVTSDIFTHMNPANYYGLLIIFKGAYGMHLFLDAYSNLYFGFSGDTFGEPSTWKAATSTTRS